MFLLKEDSTTVRQQHTPVNNCKLKGLY